MEQFLRPFAEAIGVRVVDGEVVLLGPDGVAVSLTVEAAEESARRLLRAVEAARGDCWAEGEDACPPQRRMKS